ncbi:MAG: hypothetical protein R2758_11315 [Bacteroidales bacterium]
MQERNRTNGRFRYLVIAGSSNHRGTHLPYYAGNLAIKGYRQINLAFFANRHLTPSGHDGCSLREIPGGIANRLTGSLLMVLLAPRSCHPLGLMAGIFVAKTEPRRYARFIRSLTEILQGAFDHTWHRCLPVEW